MPELTGPTATLALLLMTLVSLGLLVYFRWKGWLGGRPKQSPRDSTEKHQ
jgi:O-antigen/teichoic acid export membrane protein